MDKTIDGLNGLLGGSEDTSSQLTYGSTGSSCCDPKVDLMSLLVTIGAIAAISVFLRQAVIDNNVMGRKRRKRGILQGGKPIWISMNGFYEFCLVSQELENSSVSF